MFFVFGPFGQIFRGGPENLSKISPVHRVRRPQALRMRSIDRPDEDTPVPVHPSASTPPAVVPLRGQDAVSAYAHTVQGPQLVRQPITRVRDVMTHGAITIAPIERLHNAWQQLSEHHIGQMPVVNAQGHVVGMLLRSDMAPEDLLPDQGNVGQALALARRWVSEVMVSPVPTVSPDTELRRVAGALLDTGLPGLPVTDEVGALVGFISRTDILRAVAANPPLDLWG